MTTPKEFLQHHNRALLDDFILNPVSIAPQEQLIIKEPLALTDRVTSVTYSKTTHYLFNQNKNADFAPSISPIYINYSFKEELDSFTWHTTAKKIKEANRWGIVNVQSVTAKVISALGQYKLTHIERLEENIISDRADEKMQLVNFYQDRIECLEALETLVNHKLSNTAIIKNLGLQIGELTKLRQKWQKIFIKKPDTYAEGFSDSLLSIDDDIASIQKYISLVKTNIGDDKFPIAFTDATGSYSILTLVKKIILKQLREMQGLNQALTFSSYLPKKRRPFALTRGFLNNYIEDAVRIVEQHTADLSNPTLHSHHGVYGEDSARIAYNSKQHELDPASEQKALLAISFIEGQNSLDKTKAYTIDSLKWAIYNNIFLIAGVWLANFFVRVTFGLLDMPFQLFGRILSQFFTPTQPGSFIATLLKPVKPIHNAAIHKFTLKSNFTSKLANSDFRKTLERPIVSLGERIADKIIVASKKIWDSAVAVYDVLLGWWTIEIIENLMKDYYYKKMSDSSELTLENIGKKLNRIRDLKTHYINRAYNQSQTDSLPPIEKKSATFAAAMPLYYPDLGEWNDISNAISCGADHFAHYFLHNIHAKHSFAGLVFNASYIVGGLAVLSPSTVSFMGHNYISMSQTLGASMAKSTFSGALSSGMTQAQIISGMYELGLHGKKSWIITVLDGLDKDPATSITYMGAAVGLGYLVAMQFDIPWLSEHLKEDAGTVWPLTLGFAGAKLGIILVELLHESNPTMNSASIQLRLFLKVQYQKANPECTDNIATHHANLAYELLVSPEKLKQYKNIYDETITAADKNERFNLLKLFHQYPLELSKLHISQKQELAHMLDVNVDTETAASLKKLLYPQKVHSYARTTVNIFTNWAQLIVRFCFALFLAVGFSVQSKTRAYMFNPLWSVIEDVTFYFKKDVLRLYKAVIHLSKTFFSCLKIMVKSILDILFNSILAKIDTLFTNGHAVTRQNYVVAGKVDAAYEAVRQHLSKPLLDEPCKDVIPCNPLSTYGGIYMQLVAAKSNENAVEAAAQIEPVTMTDSGSSLSLVEEKDEVSDLGEEKVEPRKRSRSL